MKNASSVLAEPKLPPAPLLNRAEIRLPDDPFLLSRFEDFYREVVRWKRMVAASQAQSGPAPDDVEQKLTNFLSAQKSEVEHTGTLLGVEMYRQAQRVCVCLADEIFSRLTWPDGAKWLSLEARIFAIDEPVGFTPGGQCLRKLDQLLEQGDPVYRELASVYFYALALAKPRDCDCEAYMAALIQFLPLAPAAPLWFPQSYAHTLAENRIASLPSVAKWLWLLASVLVVWLGLSWFLWTRVSAPVEAGLRAIHAAATPVPEPSEGSRP
ncbi:MAG: hypothetical protein ABSD59_16365 [Terracidiphilus sp.]|jgi:type VI protein secretion system component VasF